MLFLYHICQTARAQARQHMIADTFVSMLKTQTFHTIQITALCKAAGIPRKAFYRYFDSKEDIITFLVEDMFHTLLQHPEHPVTDRATAIQRCALFFQYWMERTELLNALSRNETLGLFYGSFMNYAIKHDIYTIYGPQGLAQDRMSMILTTSGLFHLLLHWNARKEPQTAEELGEIYYKYLTKPLYSPPEG